MRLGVFSDTHGDLGRLDDALRKMGPMDGIIHLGDFFSDAASIGKMAGVPAYGVRGNCDYRSGGEAELVLELDGTRVFCTHGHRYPDLYSLSRKAAEEGCAAALFGHTHEPLLTADGALLILNPGSLSRPRSGTPACCALLTIQRGSVYADMISL